MNLGGYSFKFICNIEPERIDSGAVKPYLPQKRYRNTKGLSLNKYGKGPYCKFFIPRNLNKCGVYALTIDDQLIYIGECLNLSSRFNMGYGNISPRNCYQGGQETNCRLNHLIYSEVSKGATVSLWFLETNNYKHIEGFLRSRMNLPWNRA